MNTRAVFNNIRSYTKRLPGNAGYSSPILTDVTGDYRAYNQSVDVVTAGGSVVVQDGCFAVMFTNVGATECTVNGKKLYPFATALPLTGLGDSFTIGGHLRDLYYGQINVSFQGAGLQPALEIVQLFYIGILKDRENKSIQ